MRTLEANPHRTPICRPTTTSWSRMGRNIYPWAAQHCKVLVGGRLLPDALFRIVLAATRMRGAKARGGSDLAHRASIAPPPPLAGGEPPLVSPYLLSLLSRPRPRNALYHSPNLARNALPADDEPQKAPECGFLSLSIR